MKVVLSFLFLCNTVLCFSQKATDTVALYFTNNNYKLTPKHINIIDSIANQDEDILKHIDVIGYTNSIGSEKYNYLLSKKRAKYVADAIGQEDVGIINWKGELPSNSPKNRRVDLIIKYRKPTKVKPEITTKKLRKEPLVKKEKKHKSVDTKTRTSPENLAETQVIKEEEIIEKPVSLEKKLKKAIVGEKIVLKQVTFLRSRDILVNNSYDEIFELIHFLKNNPTVKINIQGHICCGSPQDPSHDGINVRTGKRNLSVARAKRVYQFLRKNKIKRNRMTYEGLANKFPTGEENLSLDRRVEIEIISK